MSSFAVRTFSNNYQLINCLWLIYKQFSLIVKHPVYLCVHISIVLMLPHSPQVFLGFAAVEKEEAI